MKSFMLATLLLVFFSHRLVPMQKERSASTFKEEWQKEEK